MLLEEVKSEMKQSANLEAWKESWGAFGRGAMRCLYFPRPRTSGDREDSMRPLPFPACLNASFIPGAR